MLVFLATELPGLQRGLMTTPLSGTQWLTCAGLAALLALTVELAKAVRRRRGPATPPVDAQQAVAPQRALMK